MKVMEEQSTRSAGTMGEPRAASEGRVEGPRPNLFIVGAAKCGTTSLHAYLGQHPAVFMSSNKEPHFFGSDLKIVEGWRVKDREAYLSLFRDAGQAAVIGEASTWYLFSERAAEEIKEFNPEARIVIMVRQPADFINSLHLQMVNTRSEDILDLEGALEAEADRAEGRRLMEGCRFRHAVAYRRAARFSEQVERYYRAFGRERVGVWLLEDMSRDTAGMVKGVLGFLGVDTEAPIDLARENASRSLSRVDLILKGWYYKSARVRRLVRRMPKPVMSVYRRITSRWLPSIRPKGFDPALRARLTEEFSDEIDRLGVLIERDLSHWKRVEGADRGSA